jgi:phytoene synthase
MTGNDLRMTNEAMTERAVAEAYARCEQITSAQARNFSYGIRLLPRPKRRAMCALYAMARRIDDIGDGDAEASEKLQSLGEVRKSLADLKGDPWFASPDPVLIALSDVVSRYPLPLEALDELIDGCEMDVNGVSWDRGPAQPRRLRTRSEPSRRPIPG